MYQLVSENLSGLGGPMGTEYTKVNYRKFYTTIDGAKSAAEKEYKKKIKWVVDKSGEYWRSPDLLYVMYHIRTVRVES